MATVPGRSQLKRDSSVVAIVLMSKPGGASPAPTNFPSESA
jgi:hypothetical protein